MIRPILNQEWLGCQLEEISPYGCFRCGEVVQFHSPYTTDRFGIVYCGICTAMDKILNHSFKTTRRITFQ